MSLPKLSLSAKTALSNALLVLLVIAAVGTSLFFNRQQIATADRINALSDRTSRQLPELMLNVKNIQINIIQVQQFLTDVSATRGQDGLDDGFEEAAKNAKEFGERIVATRTLAKELGASKVTQAIDQVEAAFGPYYEIGQKMAKSYVAMGPAGGNKMMPDFDKGSETLAGSMESLIAVAEDLSKQGQQEIDRETDLAAAQLQTLSYALYALGAASLLIAGLAILMIRYGVVKPLTGMVTAVAKVADGDLDTVVPGLSRGDEIALLARSLETFKEKLLMQREQDSQLAEMREEAQRDRVAALQTMAETVERETTAAVGEVSAGTGRMAGRAVQMNDGALVLGAKSTSVAAAAEQALSNAQIVATASSELSKSITEIASQVNASRALTVEAVTASGKAQATIGKLSDAASKVGAVTNLISEIASQTNLLALNATIEAARAGPAGRGFAVVAAEVKSLAEQTAKATSDISQQITEIQQATDESVRSISAIGEVIRNVESVASMISAAVEEQSAVTSEIARTVEQTSLASREVAEQIAAVSTEAVATGRHASEIKDESSDIARQVEHLRLILVRVIRTSTVDVNRRIFERKEVNGPGTLEVRGVRHPVLVHDVSEGGAKIGELNAEINIDTPVSLAFEGFPAKLDGVVARQDEQGVFLTFKLAATTAEAIRNFVKGRLAA